MSPSGTATKFNLSKKSLAPAMDFDLLMGGDSATDYITLLPVDKLVPYPHQPFKLYRNDKLRELAADIAMNGVISPICVRPHGKGYQILAGHNRTNAAKIAGLTEVPCIVKEDCDDHTAVLIVVNTNLNQREELLPSEKAFAYHMQLDAIKKMGATNCRTSAALEDQTGENKRNIQRYVRLTKLLPELLEMVDAKQIPFVAGANLSYITPEEQSLLLAFIRKQGVKSVSLKLSELIKNTRELTEDVLMSVFGVGRAKQQTVSRGKPGVASKKVLAEYFGESGCDDNEIARILDTVLKQYFSGNR